MEEAGLENCRLEPRDSTQLTCPQRPPPTPGNWMLQGQGETGPAHLHSEAPLPAHRNLRLILVGSESERPQAWGCQFKEDEIKPRAEQRHTE